MNKTHTTCYEFNSVFILILLLGFTVKFLLLTLYYKSSLNFLILDTISGQTLTAFLLASLCSILAWFAFKKTLISRDIGFIISFIVIFAWGMHSFHVQHTNSTLVSSFEKLTKQFLQNKINAFRTGEYSFSEESSFFLEKCRKLPELNTTDSKVIQITLRFLSKIFALQQKIDKILRHYNFLGDFQFPDNLKDELDGIEKALLSADTCFSELDENFRTAASYFDDAIREAGINMQEASVIIDNIRLYADFDLNIRLVQDEKEKLILLNHLFQLLRNKSSQWDVSRGNLYFRDIVLASEYNLVLKKISAAAEKQKQTIRDWTDKNTDKSGSVTQNSDRDLYILSTLSKPPVLEQPRAMFSKEALISYIQGILPKGFTVTDAEKYKSRYLVSDHLYRTYSCDADLITVYISGPKDDVRQTADILSKDSSIKNIMFPPESPVSVSGSSKYNIVWNLYAPPGLVQGQYAEFQDCSFTGTRLTMKTFRYIEARQDGGYSEFSKEIHMNANQIYTSDKNEIEESLDKVDKTLEMKGFFLSSTKNIEQDGFKGIKKIFDNKQMRIQKIIVIFTLKETQVLILEMVYPLNQFFALSSYIDEMVNSITISKNDEELKLSYYFSDEAKSKIHLFASPNKENQIYRAEFYPDKQSSQFQVLGPVETGIKPAQIDPKKLMITLGEKLKSLLTPSQLNGFKPAVVPNLGFPGNQDPEMTESDCFYPLKITSMISQDIFLNPGASAKRFHYAAIVGLTEVYCLFAEETPVFSAENFTFVVNHFFIDEAEKIKEMINKDLFHDETRYLENRIQYSGTEGHFPDLEFLVKEMTAKYPGNPVWTVANARLLKFKAAYAEAIQLCEQALIADEKIPEKEKAFIYREKAAIEEASKNFEQALADYETYFTYYPLKNILDKLIELSVKLGSKSKIEKYVSILENNCRDSKTELQVLDLYKNAGLYPRAIQIISKKIESMNLPDCSLFPRHFPQQYILIRFERMLALLKERGELYALAENQESAARDLSKREGIINYIHTNFTCVQEPYNQCFECHASIDFNTDWSSQIIDGKTICRNCHAKLNKQLTEPRTPQ